MSTTPNSLIDRDGFPTTGADGSSGARTIRFASTRRDWRAATTLLHDYIAWIEHSSSITVFAAQPDFAHELADLERAYSSATSALFLADDADTVCGTLAVRIDAGGAAELKRMYVHPAARGKGHAGRLLRTALHWAADSGATVAWLETLPGVMDPAIELYRRHGFSPARDRALVDVDSAIVMTLDLQRVVEA